MSKPRIVRTPGIQDGTPCVEGTRWPTYCAVGFAFDRAELARAYPFLTMEQIEAAISYERQPHRRLARWLRSWTSGGCLRVVYWVLERMCRGGH